MGTVPIFKRQMATAMVHLQFSPQLYPPQTETMILSVHEVSTGRGGPVILTKDMVQEFAAWLEEDPSPWHGEHEIPNGYTTALFRRRVHSMTLEELVDVKLRWNDSGETHEYVMTHQDQEDIKAFLTTALAGQWPGWTVR